MATTCKFAQFVVFLADLSPQISAISCIRTGRKQLHRFRLSFACQIGLGENKVNGRALFPAKIGE
jgi:hypothetical protein